MPNSNSSRIMEYINKLSDSSRIMAITSEAVSRKLSISLDLAEDELLNLTNTGYLKLKYEIRCLNDLNILEVSHNIDKFIGKDILCNICGKEITICESNIYKVFYICKNLN